MENGSEHGRDPEDRNDRDELIRRRAYSIWEKQGRPDGKHDEHWRQAHDEMHGLEDAPAKAPNSPAHVAPGGAKDKRLTPNE